jgi:hypothetical protein
VDDIGSYGVTRGEFVSVGLTYYTGTQRESPQGVNDGSWVPASTREEQFRYDPWGFEAHRRFTWNGELGLWYENQVGNPLYRVMLEDWELLRDQNEEFKDWYTSNNLAAWGASMMETARHNPYTEARNGAEPGSQVNNNVRWISWNVPHIWNPYPYREPSAAFPGNRFDFVGGVPYHPMPVLGTFPVEEITPLKNHIHPFHRPGGVKMPNRPAEVQALVEPVLGRVSNVRVPSRPIVVEFDLADYTGEVTKNNAQTSFDLYIDGQLTHFYFWEFIEQGNGVAKVALRLDRPIEREQYDKITIDLRGKATTLKIDENVTVTVQRGGVYKFDLLLNEYCTGNNIVWTVSDPSFALIDDEANVYILNKTGTVRLIATDPWSGLYHSITLRIAS